MVNNKDIKLEYKAGSLNIIRQNDNWFQVTISSEDSFLALGADTMGTLKKHLVRFLTSPPDEIHRILALYERHCFLCGKSNSDGGVDFLVKDADARTIAEFTLTNVERRIWLETLESLHSRI